MFQWLIENELTKTPPVDSPTVSRCLGLGFHQATSDIVFRDIGHQSNVRIPPRLRLHTLLPHVVWSRWDQQNGHV